MAVEYLSGKKNPISSDAAGFYAVDSKFQIVIVSGISNSFRCIPRGTQWISSSKSLFFTRIFAAGRFAKNKMCPWKESVAGIQSIQVV